MCPVFRILTLLTEDCWVCWSTEDSDESLSITCSSSLLTADKLNRIVLHFRENILKFNRGTVQTCIEENMFMCFSTSYLHTPAFNFTAFFCLIPVDFSVYIPYTFHVHTFLMYIHSLYISLCLRYINTQSLSDSSYAFLSVQRKTFTSSSCKASWLIYHICSFKVLYMKTHTKKLKDMKCIEQLRKYSAISL